MQGTHYRGNIDGDIKKYLNKMHENGAVCPTFTGYEPFKQLLDLELVCPEVTSIRLMFNHARGDEHYIVVDEEHLEGILLNAHSGQKGLYNTKDILTKTEAKYWEVDGLNPKAYRG